MIRLPLILGVLVVEEGSVVVERWRDVAELFQGEVFSILFDGFETFIEIF